MDIFSIISMLGGLALFLFGMHQLSAGLEKMAGGKMESVLKKVTSKRILALIRESNRGRKHQLFWTWRL